MAGFFTKLAFQPEMLILEVKVEGFRDYLLRALFFGAMIYFNKEMINYQFKSYEALGVTVATCLNFLFQFLTSVNYWL